MSDSPHRVRGLTKQLLLGIVPIGPVRRYRGYGFPGDTTRKEKGELIRVKMRLNFGWCRRSTYTSQSLQQLQGSLITVQPAFSASLNTRLSKDPAQRSGTGRPDWCGLGQPSTAFVCELVLARKGVWGATAVLRGDRPWIDPRTDFIQVRQSSSVRSQLVRIASRIL